jgi:hypothetical protein
VECAVKESRVAARSCGRCAEAPPPRDEIYLLPALLSVKLHRGGFRGANREGEKKASPDIRTMLSRQAAIVKPYQFEM